MTNSFDAIWLDAGGVLVLPDPLVLGPLLEYYGGDADVERHRRAHYAAMAAKSAVGATETDWAEYGDTYVRQVGVTGEEDVAAAAFVLDKTRSAWLWRWPIADSVAALRKLAGAGMPLGVVSNAAGQIDDILRRSSVCQVGEGPGVPVRVIVDSDIVGVTKPDPAIFDHAWPHFEGIVPHRVAYVGDSVTMDVGGASAAGLHPILLDPYDDHPDADFDRITSLSELL